MPLRRTRVHAVVATLALTGAVVAATGGSAAAAGGSFAAMTTSLRSSHGLTPYRTCADLDAIAARWAAHQAADETLAHNPSLSSQVGAWSAIGENVGEGPDASTVERALEASPEHLANLESRSFTEAGYGTATAANGTLYVDEVFRRPSGAGCGGGSAAPVPPAASRSSARSSLPSSRDTASRAASGQTTAQSAAQTAAERAAEAHALHVLAAAQQVQSMDAAVTVRSGLVAADGQRDVVGAALAFAQVLAPVD